MAEVAYLLLYEPTFSQILTTPINPPRETLFGRLRPPVRLKILTMGSMKPPMALAE